MEVKKVGAVFHIRLLSQKQRKHLQKNSNLALKLKPLRFITVMHMLTRIKKLKDKKAFLDHACVCSVITATSRPLWVFC